MAPAVTRRCSDHSYELPLRRNLLLLLELLDLLRFIAGVLLDRLGVAPCQGEMQLLGQPWGGEHVDAAAVESFLEATLRPATGGTRSLSLSLTGPRYRRRRGAQPAEGEGAEDGDHGGDEGAAVCAICLAGLEAGAGGCQTVAELRGCSHAFHAACIEAWAGSGEAATCPLCRAPMSPAARDGQSWCHARPGD